VTWISIPRKLIRVAKLGAGRPRLRLAYLGIREGARWDEVNEVFGDIGSSKKKVIHRKTLG
jgi:hypothetical protein